MAGLSRQNFSRMAAFVARRTGIRLPAGKHVMLEGRIAKRMRVLGCPTADDYVERFLAGSFDPGEELELIDCVTTNKTDFFREPDHFDFMRQLMIPELLRARGGRPPHRLKLWSAAASTGAEAYTMAMVAADLAQQRRDFSFAILGTDISTDVLEKARAAVYPEEMVQPVPADLRARFVLTARDRRRREVRIAPELRRLTRFERLNLIDPGWAVDRDVDIIFCRNVLIYFDRETQAKVVDMLAGHLRPGGYLVLGHSEAMAGDPCRGLRQIRPTVFQSTADVLRSVA